MSSMYRASQVDWENKFSSIVRETEANLAKVQERLNAARTPTSSSLDYPVHGDSFRPSRDPITSTPKPRTVRFSDSSNLSSEPLHVSNKENIDSGQAPAMWTLLSEKLDLQTKVIDTLKRTVENLERDRDQQRSKVKELENDLRVVNDRLSERGVDLQTEMKVERWRREVAAEVQGLQQELQNVRRARDGERYGVSEGVTALSRELQESKRFLQDECEALRREIEGMKTRIVKQEVDLATSISQARDISRRQDHVDKAVKSLQENHRSQSHDTSRVSADQSETLKQIKELKNSVGSIQRQIDRTQGETNQRRNRQTDNVRDNSKSKRRPYTSKGSRMTGVFDTSDIDTDVDLSSPSIASHKSSDFSYNMDYLRPTPATTTRHRDNDLNSLSPSLSPSLDVTLNLDDLDPGDVSSDLDLDDDFL
ncbi:PREDICTED: myosin-2 heavy chain, non muscle-like [Branchiostoma belcheri]|uniref:Myosin-2 heavy chain, non muscle-like n=1 Tax=Branchiostoma belcheri TaxID=7741 RepID=A0A6P4Y7S1_BRABE|nr:PREDICTED: myosin-2 heavy chain, non muscle-like [Branchiostoma belcheri]